MKQAPFLKGNELIDLVAPSFGVTTEPYLSRNLEAIKKFKKMGFRVHEGECIHLEEGVASSSSPQKRAKEIMDAFHDDSSLILSVGGGELMNEILPFIDFDEIKGLPPKWFMGFSDNTNLTFTLATLSHLISIYGPCSPQFFSKKLRYAELDAMSLLKGKKHLEGYPKYSITPKNELHPLWTYRLTQKKIITPYFYTKPMEGVLLGGCLDCLVNLCGTRFDDVKDFAKCHPEGVIWFLEACDLSPLAIRRALFELKEAGWFTFTKGFLMGRHLCGDNEVFGVNKINATLDILSSFNVPILMDIDLGHIPPSMPIKIGARAKVSFIEGNIVFDYQE